MKIKEIITKKYVVCILALICSLLWGMGFPLIKLGYASLGIAKDDTFSKLLFAGIRFFFAGVFLVGINAGKMKEIHYTNKLIRGILLLALVQTVFQYVFQYIGLSYAKGNVSSVIAQSNIFLLIFISPLFFKEDKFCFKKVSGAVLGLAGIIIMNMGGFESEISLRGEGFVAIASLMAALSFIISKKLTKGVNTGVVTGLQQIIGGAVLIIIGAVCGGRIYFNGAVSFIIMIFLIFSAAAANLIFMTLIKYNNISEVSVYKFATPLFGVIFSYFFLGESFITLKNLIALFLVCLGIIIVNKKCGKI